VWVDGSPNNVVKCVGSCDCDFDSAAQVVLALIGKLHCACTNSCWCGVVSMVHRGR
jgi:hypothetical protein